MRVNERLDEIDWALNLRNAIIVQAVEDFRAECKKARSGERVNFKPFEDFFKGEYLDMDTYFKNGWRMLRKEQIEAERAGAEAREANGIKRYCVNLSKPGVKKDYVCMIDCREDELEQRIEIYPNIGFVIERCEEVTM